MILVVVSKGDFKMKQKITCKSKSVKQSMNYTSIVSETNAFKKILISGN